MESLFDFTSLNFMLNDSVQRKLVLLFAKHASIFPPFKTTLKAVGYLCYCKCMIKIRHFSYSTLSQR